MSLNTPSFPFIWYTFLHSLKRLMNDTLQLPSHPSICPVLSVLPIVQAWNGAIWARKARSSQNRTSIHQHGFRVIVSVFNKEGRQGIPAGAQLRDPWQRCRSRWYFDRLEQARSSSQHRTPCLKRCIRHRQSLIFFVQELRKEG